MMDLVTEQLRLKVASRSCDSFLKNGLRSMLDSALMSALSAGQERIGLLLLIINDTDALLLYRSFFLSSTKTRKQVQSQVRGKGFPKPPLIYLMRPASLSLDISIFFLILPQPSRISHEDILYQRFISLTPLFALCNE